MNMNYTEQQVDKMRAALHESEFDCMTDRDIRLILWEGCVGWKNYDDDTVIEEFESFFDITDQEEMTREG